MEEYTREGVAEALGTHLIGRYIRWHETLGSTNDLAMSLAEIQVPEGTVIVAEEQTAGRGRRGSQWVSPRGGIWLSVILRPGLSLPQTPLVGFGAATAVARTLRLSTGLLARVKWPNDIVINGKKVAGILVDAGPGAEWAVVGIGINANLPSDALPERTPYPATSLQVELGRPVDRGVLVRTLLRELEKSYDLLRSGGALATLRRWREMADTLGRPVRVTMGETVVEGLADDVDETGALLVRRRDNTVERVVAGELTIREVER
jgi:BirA family transcriptional regulator, biotin operon repressor / biotin---[acetyl-CoA-carboxylase] ligase